MKRKTIQLIAGIIISLAIVTIGFTSFKLYLWISNLYTAFLVFGSDVVEFKKMQFYPIIIMIAVVVLLITLTLNKTHKKEEKTE